MRLQAPLPLAPAGGVQVGEVVWLAPQADGGGQVFIRGDLSFVWDGGDEAGRRFAAVQLARIKAGTAVDVAAAFGVDTVTLWRWGKDLAAAGVAGLVPAKTGPKGPSRLTPQVVAEVRARREAGASLADIAEVTGLSTASVRRACSQPPVGQPQASTQEASLTGSVSGAGRQDSEPDQDAVAEDEPGHGLAPDSGPEPDRDVDQDTEQDLAQRPEQQPDPGHGLGSDRDAEGEGGSASGLPVLGAPAPRSAERALARAGLLGHAVPVFTPAGRVPLAGLLLALPALQATGLLGCAREVYGALPDGFYGLDTMLIEGVVRALVGQSRAEGATRIDPVALGRVLGLDRAPEVKTIRRKIAQLAGHAKAGDLLAGIARHHLARHQDTDQAGLVLYVDGHVRAYHGTRKVAKTHLSRLRFPAPATVETWVSDAAGDPVLVVMAEPGASLAGELRALLPELRKAVGDDRRVLVGFDRGGWSPALFAHLDAHGFDVMTWRKGPVPDIDPDRFTDVTHVDEAGRTHTWKVAETMVNLPLGQDGAVFTMRQVTRADEKKGSLRQVHVLTTRTDLPTGQVIYRMGSRWRQENYFRYARMHFDFDSHDSYATTGDDPDRLVPNPAKKHAHAAVVAARTRYERALARTDAALLAARSPQPGHEAVITNSGHDALTAHLRTAEAELDAAQAAHRDVPARVRLGQVHPGQQVLDTQTKLIHHAIRMAAFNTATALARDIRINTSYARASHEAHVLARQVLTHTGDIDPRDGVLTVRLDPMPTPRATAAIRELCQHLSATNTTYPGTDLTIRYQIKNRTGGGCVSR
jgi:hypothetical protein